MGITPAWAGKRREPPRAIRSKKDYPRVGGEEASSSAACKAFLGLPPRGRGRVRKLVAGGAHGGITPAWAGKRRRERR